MLRTIFKRDICTLLEIVPYLLSVEHQPISYRGMDTSCGYLPSATGKAHNFPCPSFNFYIYVRLHTPRSSEDLCHHKSASNDIRPVSHIHTQASLMTLRFLCL